MRIINLQEVDTSKKIEIGFMPNPNNPDKFEEWKGFKSYFDTLNRENMYIGTIDPELDPEFDGRYLRQLVIEKGAPFKENDLVILHYRDDYWVKRYKVQEEKIELTFIPDINQPFITDISADIFFGVVRMIEKVKIENNDSNLSEDAL
jgi:hypothetical protein